MAAGAGATVPRGLVKAAVQVLWEVQGGANGMGHGSRVGWRLTIINRLR